MADLVPKKPSKLIAIGKAICVIGLLGTVFLIIVQQGENKESALILNLKKDGIREKATIIRWWKEVKRKSKNSSFDPYLYYVELSNEASSKDGFMVNRVNYDYIESLGKGKVVNILAHPSDKTIFRIDWKLDERIADAKGTLGWLIYAQVGAGLALVLGIFLLIKRFRENT